MSKFSLGQKVAIEVSGEIGKITAVCQYLSGETRYEIHYKAADGTSANSWLEESLITSI